MSLRDATLEDLPAMARLHRNAYSQDHFLALLPEAVLADYYARFLGNGSRIILAIRAPHAGSQHVTDDLLGFAVFGRDIESRVSAFKRDRVAAILRAALSHPLVATQKAVISVGGLFHGGSRHVAAPVLLLSIAVGQAGKGIGRALLEEMLRCSAQAGDELIGLYVRHNNVVAVNAYLHAGFRIVASIADQYYMERELNSVSVTRNS